jgi:hypothetical protein
MARTDLLKQEITRFLGVNLRQERLDMADEDLAKAINADLNTTVGSIVLRLGRSKQFSSPLADTTIRTLAKVNGFRYQIAGRTLYRDQATVLANGLSADLQSAVMPFRPLTDTSIWAFVADRTNMRKDNGTSNYKWGIDAPSDTPVIAAAAGSLTGAYRVKYTYARVDGSAICHESNPSPASDAVTLAGNHISITGLTASLDPQVTHIRVYRTLSGGSSYFFDQTVANGVTVATSSNTDASLGTELEDDNDVPPNCQWAVIYNETAFLLGDEDNPHYLYFSKRFRPESVSEHIELGNADDPLIVARAISGMLGVFTKLTKYRITGNTSSGYTGPEHVSHRGTPSPFGAVVTESGIVFPAKDGVFSTNLMQADVQIAEAFLPIFYGETVNDMSPINWDYAHKFCAAAYKGRYYLSYASGSSTVNDKVAVFSKDTKKWYFYNYPITAFCVEEDLDQIVGGSTDGFVYVLEDGSDDAGSSISLDVQTKDFYGQAPHARKLFLYYRVDAYVPSGSLSAKFYVDGTLKQTHTITGSRSKLLLRLPEECLGYQWRVNFTYTGTGRVEIYGVAALWLPLAMA